MVRVHPDPPDPCPYGAIAQLGERLLCKQEVTGSIPVGSTSYLETQRKARESAPCSAFYSAAL
jgi:hypothetical protein